MTFHTHSADGDTEGTIRMKGRQFVLETEGMTTWFDGRTQWTYLEEVDEVNITEPTADELQSINPYAWLSLYKQGYELKTRKVNGRLLPVTLTATDRHRQVQGMTLYIDPDTRMPRQIDMRLQGSLQPVRIVIRQCHTGLTYADSFFVFDSQKHPTAEVIDLR